MYTKIIKYSINDFEVNNINKFDYKVDELWASVNDYFKYIVVRDKNFLNWRYCDPRGGIYYIKQLEIG